MHEYFDIIKKYWRKIYFTKYVLQNVASIRPYTFYTKSIEKSTEQGEIYRIG